ncbi:MAG TPA: class II fructose-bisphosphatase [Phycisphaeraceae bacterium]|nr:class II fructose-bisphosphatase [Phycisphaeraceae bacterium]
MAHLQDPERRFGLELTRCTEAAALQAWKWFGRGDKIAADQAAADAIRGMFDIMDVKAYVAIGEGRKDKAPGIFQGEVLGPEDGSLTVAIAVDPIDGTNLTAKGLPGAISVIASASCEHPEDDPTALLQSIPSYYMEKIAVGPKVAQGPGQISLEAPLEDNLDIVAFKLGKRISDLVVVVLDRPRHAQIIETLRESGCRIRLITDGDVAAAIGPSLPNPEVDLYIGIGGSPEAVLSAAAIKCLGGAQYCRVWPRDENEKRHLIEHEGYTDEDFQRIYSANDLAKGDRILFSATGISDSPLLPGLRFTDGHAISTSVLMRSKYRTIRYVETHHNLQSKTIHLASSHDEVSI